MVIGIPSANGVDITPEMKRALHNLMWRDLGASNREIPCEFSFDIDELYAWMQDLFGDRMVANMLWELSINQDCVYFRNQDDAIAFKLRWC